MSAANPRFRPRTSLLLVYLLLLMGLGAGAALVLLPLDALRIATQLGVAGVMATLIAVYFMDMRKAGGLMRVFALGGLLWLLFMFILLPADWLTR